MCSTPGNEFDDLGCFDIAYDARSRPDDTGRSFGPGCECRAVGKEVGVSFTFFAVEYRYLTLESFDTPVYIRFLQSGAPIVDKVTRGIIVATIDDNVVWFDNFPCIFFG